MIKIEDYENLIKYFEEHKTPDNLKIFIEKIRIMYKEILYRKESQEKMQEFEEALRKLSEEE